MHNAPPAEPKETPPWLPQVVKRVLSLRFGSVQIKVRDGKVVLVESLQQRRYFLANQNHGPRPKNKPDRQSP